MTNALEDLSWDLALADGGPRRPSLADVGGATLEDDIKNGPDKSRMLYAALCNQLQKQIAAMGKVVDLCEISIEYLAGVPTIVSVIAPGTNITIASFSAPTDDGDGDTTITWPAGTLPPASGKPAATLDEDGTFLAPFAENVTLGVHVMTRNSAGALTDVAFTVRVR